MSGIAGIVNLDGRPVELPELGTMTAALACRGPDRRDHWRRGPVGLGHTLLATTPSDEHDSLPLADPASSCVITADARLDNRSELLGTLGLSDRSRTKGNGALILAAYLRWGEECVRHLLGDFAFAIWDQRYQRVFCGRDHFGVRPFYYWYVPHASFVFASEPRAIALVPRVRYRINEGRIADFLVRQLEGIDRTSTFFVDINRMPPAHTMVIEEATSALRRYWALKPSEELRLRTDADYADMFLHTLTSVVESRAQGDSTGAMLSGGMDSGAIVAVARDGRIAHQLRPLTTISAISTFDPDCAESRAISQVVNRGGIRALWLDLANLASVQESLLVMLKQAAEPFDNFMTMVRGIYLTAAEHGVRVVLDGIDGDSLLSEGNYIAELLNQRRWIAAYREAAGRNRFYGLTPPTLSGYLRAAVSAQLSSRVSSQFFRRFRNQPDSVDFKHTFVTSDFANRVNLADRLRTLSQKSSGGRDASLRHNRMAGLDHPYLTVGLERYGRVASVLGIEPRHPLLDLRIVDFCLRLPGHQLLHNGWPKAILRNAMQDLLPEEVVRRRGKEHLGWAFTRKLVRLMEQDIPDLLHGHRALLQPYVDVDTVLLAAHSLSDDADDRQVEAVFAVVSLCHWLLRNQDRPKVPQMDVIGTNFVRTTTAGRYGDERH